MHFDRVEAKFEELEQNIEWNEESEYVDSVETTNEWTEGRVSLHDIL